MTKKLLNLLNEEGYIAYCLENGDLDLTGALSKIEGLLNAVGHLLEANNEEILPDPGDLYGLGTVLKDQADELRQIRNYAERSKKGWMKPSRS